MKIIKKIDRDFEKPFLILLFCTMIIVLFAQIIMRFVFSSSLSWSEELSRYCFTYLVFIGISYAVKNKRHLNLTIIVNFFNEKTQQIVGIIANLIFIIFAFLIFNYSLDLTLSTIESGQEAPSLGISKGIVYAAGPLGMALTIIRLVQDSLFKIKDVFR